jgi:hypothetical protein
MTTRFSLAWVVLCLVHATAASAQDTPLVRRSAVATPRITSPAVIRQQRVEVAGIDALADGRSQAMTLDLFPDVSVRALRVSTDGTALRRTWTGVLEGYPDSSVVLVTAGGEVLGHVHTPFGFFRLERQADGSYLVQQVDQSMFPESADAIVPDADVAGPAAAAAEIPEVAADDDGSVVDVLVGVTTDAVAGFGGEGRARAAVDLVVAETNTALRNSGMTWRVRLVHVAVVPYVETGNYSLDLNRATATSDGFLDELPALRQTYQADLVALIVDRMNGACGVANVSSPFSSGSFAYSVTYRACTANGRTFAHELGHNLGATHDWYVSTGGAFSYAKGYVSLAGRFRDLMSYSNLCADTATICSQWLGFANPNLTQNGQRAGVPAGTTVACQIGNINNPSCDADVVRTFTSMFPVVARFRDSAKSIAVRFEMLPGATIRSPDNRYRIVYQTDGNLVIYDDVLGTAPWGSRTGGTAPGRVIMQNDGNLVIYDAAGRGIWGTGTTGNPDAFAVLQNDGNLVVYSAAGVPLWGRFGN